jgi:hypothetical protein
MEKCHMLTLLESKSEIAAAQRNFKEIILSHLKTSVVKNVGYPGRTEFNRKLFTDGFYWYYGGDHKEAKIPRHLNWFGRFDQTPSQQITIEINTAYSRPTKQIAGFFAKDHNSGVVYILHSGRVGGGTRGVGKTAFFAWSNQSPVEVVDSSGKVRDGIIFIPISDRVPGRGVRASATP